MNLKNLRKIQVFSPINRLLSSRFVKRSGITQDSMYPPTTVEIISPGIAHSSIRPVPNTKTQLENERQQVQGIIYATTTPLR